MGSLEFGNLRLGTEVLDAVTLVPSLLSRGLGNKIGRFQLKAPVVRSGKKVCSY